MSEQVPNNEPNNEFLEKIKKEKENYKKALELEKEEKAKLMAQLKEKEEAELKAKEDFKTIAQKKEEEANTWKSKFEQTQNEIINATKLGAIRKEFEKLGADSKSFETLSRLVDLNAVKIEKGENDKIIGVYGAEDEVKRIKDSIPQVFGTTGGKPNHNSPDINNNPMDLEKFSSLPLAEQKAKMGEIFKAQGIELKR